jgi:hypothetical protein
VVELTGSPGMTPWSAWLRRPTSPSPNTCQQRDSFSVRPTLKIVRYSLGFSADKTRYNRHGARMPELVTIPVSFIEVAIDYENPNTRLVTDRAAVVQHIFEALLPWNFKIDDIEILNSGRNSEQGAMFRLPHTHVSFFVGPTLCRFSRDAVAWNLADETLSILETVLSALTRSSGVVLGTKRTAIGLHLQPQRVPFMELLRPFVPTQLASLESEPVVTMATIVKWGNRRVTIDGSGTLANGVFLKLEREFMSDIPYTEVARQLFNDEQELLKIVGVEEDLT